MNEKGMTNKEFAQTNEFRYTCKLWSSGRREVLATKRQASKFRNKRGILYNLSNGKLSTPNKGEE